jgi:hypothetical protein
MNHLLTRTSITIDEAISILLGRSSGPILLMPVNGTDDDGCCGASYCLRDDLEDELDVLEGAYAEAEYEKQPDHVIAEKHTALQRQQALIDQANAYLCAIEDELNKGEHSILKVDSVLSNPANTFITLHSFNEWAKRVGKAVLVDLPSMAHVLVAHPSPETSTTSDPRKKMRDQEQAILDEIIRQGYDPKALPPLKSGKSGVKAVVRKALNGKYPFDKTSSFKRAWEQLRDDESIAEKEPPSSLQIDQ